MTPITIGTLIATVIVAIGFGDLPYGYYMLLRLFLCGLGLYLLAGANLALPDWQRWTLGGFAVLYNPVVPIRIGDKDIWEVLNVATVAAFWLIALRRYPTPERSSSSVPPRESERTQRPQTDGHSERESRMRNMQIQEDGHRRQEASERLEKWQTRAYRK